MAFTLIEMEALVNFYQIGTSLWDTDDDYAEMT